MKIQVHPNNYQNGLTGFSDTKVYKMDSHDFESEVCYGYGRVRAIHNHKCLTRPPYKDSRSDPNSPEKDFVSLSKPSKYNGFSIIEHFQKKLKDYSHFLRALTIHILDKFSRSTSNL